MKKLMLVVLVVLLFSGCGDDCPTQPDIETVKFTAIPGAITHMVNRVNNHRESKGLEPLLYECCVEGESVESIFKGFYKPDEAYENLSRYFEGIYLIYGKGNEEGQPNFTSWYDFVKIEDSNNLTDMRVEVLTGVLMNYNAVDTFITPNHKYLYVTAYIVGDYICMYAVSSYSKAN